VWYSRPLEVGAPRDPFIGLVLDGRYEIIEAIGSGGMGAVYRARHKSTAPKMSVVRDVAIKFLRGAKDDASLVARFQVEARVISKLEHPSSLTYFDSGQTADGTPYLVTELLQGESLARRLERGPLAPSETLRILDEVLAALEEAHALGIVHRDLKPDNLFLTKNGVKVLDFGIAKILEGDSPHTQTGALIGTPRYLSPEQAKGGPIDPRSDLYSLGVVAYHCLAGRPPFDGNSMRVLMDHLEQAPPPLATDPTVARIVMRLLEKDREKRPPTARAVRDAIGALAAPAPLPKKRSARRVVVVVAAATMAAIAVIIPSWPRERAPAPETKQRPAAPPPKGMVAIAGGTYRFGSTAEEIGHAYAWCRTLAGDECRREVYEREVERTAVVEPFFIDEREVTVSDLVEFVRDRADRRELAKPDDRAAYAFSADGTISIRDGAGSQPATHVTFAGAVAYCRSKGRALPTEAQWEAAARGLARRTFPWGDDPPDCALTSISRGAGMPCAGQPLPDAGASPQDRTPEGARDLGGGVAEWTEDVFDAGRRVVKGGYFDMWPEAARAAGRSRWAEVEVAHNIGFRCAAPAEVSR
jgi:formylglycine-generating enzyme required for sulfatase activity/tRNA A-37 threonylcarbamoyl transferase component Bud32